MPDLPPPLFEQTLVVRTQLGDEAAFAELLALEGPRLLLFLRRMTLGMPDCADDLAQDIWLAIFRGLPSLQDVTKFRPWAFRIARDRIHREHRRRRLPVQPLETTGTDDLMEPGDSGPAVDVEELQLCLGVISPEHREVLVLHFLEQMSYEDIARVTGSALGTIRSRLHYGKRALRRALENQSHELTKSPPAHLTGSR